MRALVTGARGLLATALVRELTGQGHVVALDRAGLDITDAHAVARAVADAAPDVLVNCAAYNDVDRAQQDAEAALAVNAIALIALARAARDSRAILVHYSTDFVFDGESGRPYTEDDEPNPRSVYASSKLLGEWLAAEYPATYVLRVESLFGQPAPGGTLRGSLGTLVRRIRDGERVPVFADRTVSPSCTADVARATHRLVAERHPPGVYHCVNSGHASWLEIATTIAELLDRPADLELITLETARLSAPRPRYAALSNAKLAGAGIAMPTWQEALRRHLLG